jgi:hypothetical protein
MNNIVSLTVPVLFGIFFFQAMHVLIWRWRPSHSPRIYLMTVLMAVSLLASVIFHSMFWPADPAEQFAIVSVGICAEMGYLYFYSGLARSVSLTILARLSGKGQPMLSLSNLVDDYLQSSRFEDRLEVMRQSGWITVTDGLVRLTERGRLVARGVRFISTLLCGGLEG